MVMRISTFRLCAPLAALVVGCSAPSEFRELPDDYAPPPNRAIQALIANYEAATPERRPSGIQRVFYNGSPAYLVASPCCDHFNYLYDAQGLRLCAPSGGIAGKGDGKCTGALITEGALRASQQPAPKPR
jgi:hypothetical protein